MTRVRYLLKTMRSMPCDAQATLTDLPMVGESKAIAAFGLKAMFGQKDASLNHGQKPSRFALHKVVACQLWMKSKTIAFKGQDVNMIPH